MELLLVEELYKRGALKSPLHKMCLTCRVSDAMFSDCGYFSLYSPVEFFYNPYGSSICPLDLNVFP